MKIRLTLNNLILLVQTICIVWVVYSGENGLMGYGAEKMALAVACSLLGLYLNKRIVKPNKHFKTMPVLMSVILLVLLRSYVYSYSRAATMPHLLRFLFLFLLLFVCYDVLYVKKICGYVKVFGVFVAVAYIITFPFLGKNAGIYLDYQYTGQVVSIASLFFIPGFFQTKKAFHRSIVALGILFFALILTGKRTLSVVPIILIFVVFLLTNDRQKVKKILISTIGAVLVFGILYFFVPAVQSMMTRLIAATTDNTMTSRVFFWQYALMLWETNPVFGIGFGSFATHIATGGVDLQEYHYIEAYAAHNIYYQMLAEIGIVGLVAFILFFAVGLVFTFRLLKQCQRNKDNQAVSIVLTGMLCQCWFILYGLTGNPLYMPGQVFVYFFGLMLVSCVKNSKSINGR